MKNENNSWLAGHIYHNGNGHRFLAKGIKPFTKQIIQEGLADQFFFIRYNERGRHYRLRFKGKAQTLTELVKPRMKAYFLSFFEKYPSFPSVLLPTLVENPFPDDSVQFIEYEPEYTRYGGPFAIQIAEDQFQYSSSTVLEEISSHEQWEGLEAKKCAVRMHLGLVHAFRMSPSDMDTFFQWVHNIRWGWILNYRRSSSSLQEVEPSVNGYFKTHRDSLTSHTHHSLEGISQEKSAGNSYMEQWDTNMGKIAIRLNECHETGQLEVPEVWLKNLPEGSPASHHLWPILESYIHMTNNRLGINPIYEGHLALLIAETLKHHSSNSSHQS